MHHDRDFHLPFCSRSAMFHTRTTPSQLPLRRNNPSATSASIESLWPWVAWCREKMRRLSQKRDLREIYAILENVCVCAVGGVELQGNHNSTRSLKQKNNSPLLYTSPVAPLAPPIGRKSAPESTSIEQHGRCPRWPATGHPRPRTPDKELRHLIRLRRREPD